ncbi:MAG: hypothetical protein WCT04_19470 [Planctomycetota bacterium]
MDTLIYKPSLYERHPELKISPEELKKRNERARATMRRWIEEGDEGEQRETGDVLMKALAEARESNQESR